METDAAARVHSDVPVVHEYFRKRGQTTCPSPLIELEAAPPLLAVAEAEKENGTSMATTNERIRTMIKLSKKSGSDLENTLRKLAAFLSIESDIDVGKCKPNASRPALLTASQKTLTLTHKPSSETAYTLQTLQTLNCLCKFCESLIENVVFEDQTTDNNNKENKLCFCSLYCRNSYRKALLMRRSNLKVAVQANSKLSLIMSSSDATTPGEERSPKRLSDQGVSAGAGSVTNVIRWSANTLVNQVKSIKSEAIENLSTLSPVQFESIRAPASEADKRICVFCQTSGDQDANGPSRLLSMDVDQWSHLNCALWSDGVYETMNGSLVNVDVALRKSANVVCALCHRKGASIKCFTVKCSVAYHLPCALKDKCLFSQDKTVLCPAHAVKMPAFVDNRLTDLSVTRNVWIQRDEVAQIQRYLLKISYSVCKHFLFVFF